MATATAAATSKKPLRKSKSPRGISGFLAQLGVLVAIVILWQGYYLWGIGPNVLRKSPAEVWKAFAGLMADGTLQSNLWATMQAVIIALVLAGIVGTTIGLALALMPRLEHATAPVISGLNSMPRVALAPVFIIAFGIGITAKVALAFSVVVFVFLLNARAGVNSADPEILRLARTLGMSKVQQFFKVLLPVATPSIFAAVRLGLIYSLLGVVTSELITARDGLGQLVAQYSAGFNMAAVYAILIVLAVVAGVLNALTGLAERWVLRWQAPQND